jgi:hypothetical protein
MAGEQGCARFTAERCERTRDRLVRIAPKAEIVWLPEAGHLLMGHAATIDGFLGKALAP